MAIKCRRKTLGLLIRWLIKPSAAKPSTGNRKGSIKPSAINYYKNLADPWARWGWDSYNKEWFFGYTMYHLSVHNEEKHVDLPIYLQFADGNRFDGVTLISALAHARLMYKDIFYFKFLTADSAHDNYATYRMLSFFSITPVIDLNKRGSNSDNPSTAAPLAISDKDACASPAATVAGVPSITSSTPIFNEGRRPMKNKKCDPILIRADGVPISENGRPICPIGVEMTNWGADKKRFRNKFRCPAMAGSISYCSLSEDCSSSDYGKVVYTKPDDDPRLYTAIPRDSPQWKRLYNNRSSTERVNTRILTDYQLEQPKRYGRRKLCFFAFDNAINVHLDAQARFSDFDCLLSPWKEAV